MWKFFGSVVAIGLFYVAFCAFTSGSPDAAVFLALSGFGILAELR